jgi:hypothetical protein
VAGLRIPLASPPKSTVFSSAQVPRSTSPKSPVTVRSMFRSVRVAPRTTPVAVIVRLKVVLIDPSNEVVASRSGRKSTPSGVEIVSGTLTSTQAIAPS